MIRSLRRRHLITIVLLAIVLPILVIAAMVARRSFEPMEQIPEPLRSKSEDAAR